MNVLKINPRGACHGVVSAIQIAVDAAHDETLPKPIYVLGMIVHNEHYTQAFNSLGIITLDSKEKTRLDLLDEISSGTVIMTAHGVSPEVIHKAHSKGLKVIDATCSDVTKTHTLIANKVREGFHFIYIGKKGHPESEGAVGVAKDFVHLIDSIEDVSTLSIPTDKIIITNQTTLSLWDVASIAKAVQLRFPVAQFHREICTATQVRQEAVADVKDVDLVIVVGDKHSHNTKKLAAVSEEIASIPSIRISDVSDLAPQQFIENNIHNVAVTSGASTPTPITKQVIQYLEQFNHTDQSTWVVPEVITAQSLLPRSRRKTP